MATAAISLKFSPLVKNRSKCCLEIVPQVSSIQNIDKIKWSRDAETIEYTVPITYKIKLKKLYILNDNQNLIQNYYSCVDLIHSSSFAYLNKAAGDVLKSILSDHQIYTKPDFNNAKILRPIAVCSTKDGSNKEIKHRPSKQSITTCNTPSDNLKSRQDTQNRSTCVDEHYLINKNNNIKNKCDHSNRKISKTISTTIIPNLPLLENMPNEVKSLSIAPICKINTNEKLNNSLPLKIKDLSDSLACYKPNNMTHKYKNNLDEIGIVVNPPKWNFSFSPHFFKLPDISYHRPYNTYQTSVKSHPRVRVAHFKSAMEREILPLKIILHDLLTKCAALGFLKNETCIQSIDSSKNNTYLNVSLKQSEIQKRCNRVVYSIVFDE